MSRDKKNAEKQRIMSVIKRARGMRDIDFVVKKTDLAKEVMKRYTDLIDKFNEFTEFASTMHGGLTKEAQYFLNPRIIPLLEKHRESISKISSVKKMYAFDAGVHVTKQNIKMKPPMEEFSHMLNLNHRQKRTAWNVISKGKNKTWQLLSRPRSDGINIPKEIHKIETSGMNDSWKMTKFFEILSLDIPGTNETYFERISQFKTDVESKLEKVFSEEQFGKFKISKVDVLDIQE